MERMTWIFIELYFMGSNKGHLNSHLESVQWEAVGDPMKVTVRWPTLSAVRLRTVGRREGYLSLLALPLADRFLSLSLPYCVVPSLVALMASEDQQLSNSPSGLQGKVGNVRHLASCTKKPLDSLPLHCETVTPGLARLYPVSRSNVSY